MVSRRQFLATSSSVAAFSLAGCLNGSKQPTTSTPVNNTDSDQTETEETQTSTEQPSSDELLEIAQQVSGNLDEHPYIGVEDPEYKIYYFTDVDCSFCYQWENSTFLELYSQYIEPGTVGLEFRPVGLISVDSEEFATFSYELLEYDITVSDWVYIWMKASELDYNQNTVTSEDAYRSLLDNRDGLSEDEISQIISTVKSYTAEEIPTEIVDNNERTSAIYDANATPFFVGTLAEGSLISDGISISGNHPIESFERLFNNLDEKYG